MIVNPCVICGKESVICIVTVTNEAVQDMPMQDCKQDVKDYCVEHDPMKQESEEV